MTRTEFEQALSPEVVRTMRVVQIGMMTGPTLFAAIIGFLSTRPHPTATPKSIALVLALSCVHVVATLAGIVASSFLPKRFFSPARLEGKPAAEWVKALQSALIVRLQCLALPTLLGLVVCIQAVFGGVLPRYGIYWLNLGSLVLLLAVGVATLPTRERLIDGFERRIGTA